MRAQDSPENGTRLHRIHPSLGSDKAFVKDTSKESTMQNTDLSLAGEKTLDLASIIERKRCAWSAAALAQLLECSEKHIYALAKSGRMPHLRIDGMIRFDPYITAEWLRKRIVAI
jgi:hypothetical protein